MRSMAKALSCLVSQQCTACLVKELLVGCDRLLIEVIALPVECHAVAMTGIDMPVQRVVCQIGLSSNEPLNLDWPLPDVEIVPVHQTSLDGLIGRSSQELLTQHSETPDSPESNRGVTLILKFIRSVTRLPLIAVIDA